MTPRETNWLAFLCTVWGAVVYYWIIEPPDGKR
jgi:flagellar motor component MotA